MNYRALILEDLEKGYSKADLERFIGLPKNNLSGILKGDRRLSKKSELKIELWNKSEKPNPLTLHEFVCSNGAKEGQSVEQPFVDLAKNANDKLGKAVFQDLTKPTVVSEVKEPPKTNYAINIPSEPKEGSGAFFLKYGAASWAELELQKQSK